MRFVYWVILCVESIRSELARRRFVRDMHRMLDDLERVERKHGFNINTSSIR